MLSISQLPPHDRPRERMLAKGAQALTDRELLAVFIGSGTKQFSVMELADKLLHALDIKAHLHTAKTLQEMSGLGRVQGLRLLAAQEFFRRRMHPMGDKIQSPGDTLKYISQFAAKKQEYFLCLYVNGAHELLDVKVITIGLLDRVQIHPREVFEPAISLRAAGIILAHNHPTTELLPSDADIKITKKLIQAGKLLGVKILDHLIFNKTNFFSFLEQGKF